MPEPVPPRGLRSVAKKYANDARRDFKRSNLHAAIATLTVLGGTGLAAWRLLENEIRPAIAIALLCLGASAPSWWQADRYRRSAIEHRRMERHLLTVAPLLGALDGASRSAASLAIAQRLFSRPFEDSDPLREPLWPTFADLPQPAKTTLGGPAVGPVAPDDQPDQTIRRERSEPATE